MFNNFLQFSTVFFCNRVSYFTVAWREKFGGGGEHLEGKLLEACSCKEWHFVFFPSLYVKCG